MEYIDEQTQLTLQIEPDEDRPGVQKVTVSLLPEPIYEQEIEAVNAALSRLAKQAGLSEDFFKVVNFVYPPRWEE